METITFSANEIQEFKQECSDIVLNIEETMLTAASTDGQMVIEQLFRSFHNIKGMAGFMSWANMQSISSNAESILDHHRANKSKLIDASINILKQAVELIKNCLDSNDMIPPDRMDNYINYVSNHLLVATKVSRAEQTNAVISLESILDADEDSYTTIKDLINYIAEPLENLSIGRIISKDVIKINKVFEEIAHIVKSNDIEFLQRAGFVLNEFFTTFASNSQLFSKKHIDKALHHVDVLNALLFVQKNQLPLGLVDKYISDIDQFAQEIEGLISKKQTEIFSRVESIGSFTFRIDVDFMIQVMNQIEHLYLQINQLKASGKHIGGEFDRLYDTAAKVQTMMRKVTRIPLKQLFFRFARVVKNAAELVNKQIDFFITGEDIEIDRSFLEPLNTAVIHILRNSCDHGIETPSERLKLGKSQNGKIEINPIIEGKTLTLEIKDDGQGLDREKIGKKLLSLKWFTPEELKNMSDDEVFYQVFKPGFSTTSTVTDISGRGVGMDIVNREISKLNGTIKILSKPNQGLTIKLIVPYTIKT